MDTLFIVENQGSEDGNGSIYRGLDAWNVIGEEGMPHGSWQLRRREERNGRGLFGLSRARRAEGRERRDMRVYLVCLVCGAEGGKCATCGTGAPG